MRPGNRWFFRIRLACLLAALLCLCGCASFGRGVTEAVLASQGRDQEDRRQCIVDGEAFTGLAPLLRAQAEQGAIATGDTGRHTTKLVYIHGIGVHQPGHGARLLRSLAQEMGLDVRAELSKRIVLAPPSPPERPMGEVNFARVLDTERQRELIFVELTWDAITLPEREAMAFDASAVHTSQRAALNQNIRNFTNNVLPDPLAFAGNRGDDILDAVQQTMCWAVSTSWDALPATTQGMRCEESPSPGARVSADDLVIATHSLGSRATVDALQKLAQSTAQAAAAGSQPGSPFAGFSEKTITLFMLSNQLPLLEAGRDSQLITGRRQDYCGADAPKSSERFLGRLDMIAITDPNDLLSYPVPQRWVDEYLDSRLCVNVRNVTINIAPVRSLPVFGEFADPLVAHTGYVGDPRVIALMTGGIGHDEALPLTVERCSWVEVDPGLN